MHKLIGQSKKRLVIIVAVILLVISLLVGGFFAIQKLTQDEEDELGTLLQSMPVHSTPDEAYVETLSEFAASTKDVNEKARAYITLGNSYSQMGKYKESLAAYETAMQLADEAGLSKEERAKLDEDVRALKYQVQVNEGAVENPEGGFKEPNE